MTPLFLYQSGCSRCWYWGRVIPDSDVEFDGLDGGRCGCCFLCGGNDFGCLGWRHLGGDVHISTVIPREDDEFPIFTLASPHERAFRLHHPKNSLHGVLASALVCLQLDPEHVDVVDGVLRLVPNENGDIVGVVVVGESRFTRLLCEEHALLRRSLRLRTQNGDGIDGHKGSENDGDEVFHGGLLFLSVLKNVGVFGTPLSSVSFYLVLYHTHLKMSNLHLIFINVYQVGFTHTFYLSVRFIFII